MCSLPVSSQTDWKGRVLRAIACIQVSGAFFCLLLRHKYYYSFPPLHFLHCLIFKGVIATEIGRNMGVLQKWLFLPMSKLFFLDPEGGAQTTLYCALQEGLEPLSGRYFSSCALQNVSAQGRDDALAKKLWEVSERLCGLSWVSLHRFVEQHQRDHQQLYERELLKFVIYCLSWCYRCAWLRTYFYLVNNASKYIVALTQYI